MMYDIHGDLYRDVHEFKDHQPRAILVKDVNCICLQIPTIL
jgi:hypothetical protein